MPEKEIELNPVSRITVDAIGKPGSRVFFIQGVQGMRTITLLVEKVQVQTLALGIEQFLSELAQRFPDQEAADGTYDERLMQIQPPVDPLFRIGELSLGYDSDNDRIVLNAHEIAEGGQEPEDVNLRVVRFWCTRDQALAMARWGLEICNRGRPICPYCGQPMDPEGHFCPKKNGHKH